MFDYMRRSLVSASGDFGLWLGQFLKFLRLDLDTAIRQHRGQTQLSKFGMPACVGAPRLFASKVKSRIQCDHWSRRETRS